MSCLGLYFVASSLACHVLYALQHFFKDVFIFLLSFIFSFMLHPSCIIFYPCSYLLFFPSFLLIVLSIRDKKGGEYTGEYTGLYCHFYMTYVHALRGSNFTSCTFVGGESHRGDAYTKGDKTFFYEKTLFYFMLVFSLFYGALSYVQYHLCFVALIASYSCALVGSCSQMHILLVFCIGRVLDMHLSLCYCALLIACSNDHLLCYMIIVVIPI